MYRTALVSESKTKYVAVQSGNCRSDCSGNDGRERISKFSGAITVIFVLNYSCDSISSDSESSGSSTPKFYSEYTFGDQRAFDAVPSARNLATKASAKVTARSATSKGNDDL